MAKGNRRRRRPAGTRVERPAAAETPVEPEASERGADALDRTDLLYAAAATVAAAVLFLTTFSTHVALGDAPESVAGVKTLGVLHAPGYPSYVLFANVFAHVFAFGSWAARVNGFSLACAALTIGAAYLLARRFRATRFGAALGCFTLATAASYWFNADFAKHYAFSGLVVTLAALATTSWLVDGRGRNLVIAGVLLGIGAGASWELALIMFAALGLVVVFGDGRARPVAVAGAVGGLVVVAVASYAFMMWRASRHPAVNWGEVDTLHRLIGHVSQQDFRGANRGGAHQTFGSRVPTFLGIVFHDLGLGALVAAAAGAVLGIRGLDRGRKLALLVASVANFLAIALVAGVNEVASVVTAAGGYLLDLLVVLAVLVALGATPLVDLVSDLVARATTPDRYLQRIPEAARRYRPYVAGALVVAVLLPSLLVHFGPANHRQPPLADNYATRMLSELPHGAVVVIDQASDAFPIAYRQSVFGDRPDVSVVVATNIQFGWYRDQITRQLHLRAPIPANATVKQVVALVQPRPVFVDQGMIFLYRGEFTVKLRGLVGQVVASRADATIDRDVLSHELLAADRADGFAGHAHGSFPNAFAYYFYARAHLELAKLYARAGELPRARTEIARSLDVYPDDNTRLVLQFSGQPNEPRSKVVEVIDAL